MDKIKKRVMKKLHTYGHTTTFRVYLAMLFPMILLVLLKLPDAYYKRDFQLKNLKCMMGDSFIATEADSKAGKFSSGPGMALEKGDYIVTLLYSSSSDKNYFRFQTDVNPDTVENFGEQYPLSVTDGKSEAKIPLHINSYTEALNFDIFYGGSGRLHLYSIKVEGQDWHPANIFVIGFLALFFYLMAGWLYFSEDQKIFGVFVTFLSCSILSVYPYFSDFLYEGDDMCFHLGRIIGIRDGLLSGQFPVRVSPSLYYGAGYDNSLYYPDLFLYIPALLCLLGVSLAVSVYIFVFFIHLAAAWIMYYAARKMGGTRTTGMLCGILYVFCYYLWLNLYIRFALGESLAMCFFPLVICGFYRIVLKGEKEWRPLCLGMTGIVMSHIISVLFALVLLVFFSLIFIQRILRKETLLTILKSAAAAVSLCAWFLVPFFRLYQDREYTNIVFMDRDFPSRTVKLRVLFECFHQGRHASLGPVLTLGALLCIYLVLNKKTVLEHCSRKMLFALSSTGFFIALCATTVFPWKTLAKVEIISRVVTMVQHPWRLIGVASAFLSLAAGFALAEAFGKHSSQGLVFLVFGISYILFSYKTDTYPNYSRYLHYYDALPTTDINQDYLFQNTYVEALKDMSPEIPDSGITLSHYEKEYGNVKMTVSAEPDSYVDTTLLYFTGHKAFDKNGNELPCTFGTNNRMRVQFPDSYAGEVTVRYTGFLIWRIFDVISFLSLMMLIGNCIWETKNRKQD